jgi:thiamine-monophosphate kinase
MNEAQRIARLLGILGTQVPGVRLGIGDDAAVFDAPAEPLVWSIDAAVEGVHFERRWLGAEDIGYRATMAALSDLAAMGARPLGVLAALILPPTIDDAFVDGLARGQRRAADALSTAVVGGNLSRGGELSVTTAVLGTSERPLRRDGAMVGDRVWLAGPVGLARVGLEGLLRGAQSTPEALAAFRGPVARIEAGLDAARVASSAIDVSDGLALDAARVAEASGVAIAFEPTALVDDTLEQAARSLGLDALEVALEGGEDYALLVTTPEGVRPGAGFRSVGRVRARSEAERRDGSRVFLVTETGEVPVKVRGFDHFA